VEKGVQLWRLLMSLQIKLRWKCIHDELWTTEYKGFIMTWDGSMCSCLDVTTSSNSIKHILHCIDDLLKNYY
jgi:hypothetical protein